jgi:SAM-dependent methyltransferase
MNCSLHLDSVVQIASTHVLTLASQMGWYRRVLVPGTESLALPLILGAACLVVLLVVALLVWGWRRRARPSGRAVPAEAPELADLRTAETTEELRFCVELARSVGGPVLELGSGTGRIALELAQRGLAVTGLEPSRRMVQWAKTKAEQRSAQHQTEWVEGELTNFTLGGRKFKLILAPGNVLQRVGDALALERCLASVADHLEPDGTFVAIVEPPRWEALSFARRYLKTVYNPRTGELINIYHSLDVDPFWQQLRETYTHEIWDQRGHRREVVVPFEGNYLTCPQMALLLRVARMKLEAVYGSFAREPLTLKSWHMIFVARLLPEASQFSPTPGENRGASEASKASGTLRPQPGAVLTGTSAATGASIRTGGVRTPLRSTSGATPGSSPAPAATSPLRATSSARGGSRASGIAGGPPAQGSQAASQIPPGWSNTDVRRSSKPAP